MVSNEYAYLISILIVMSSPSSSIKYSFLSIYIYKKDHKETRLSVKDYLRIGGLL
jgi:hypothetical protein